MTAEATDEVCLRGYELWNVFYAIIEAKFHENPFDHRIAPSPLLAEVLRRMSKAIVAGGEPEDQWRAWYRLTPDRREWRVALNHVRLVNDWLDECHEKRIQYVRDLLSPYEIDDQLVERFISEAFEISGKIMRYED